MLVSMASFCFGIVVFVGLIPHPKEIGIPSPDEVDETWMETSTSLTISMCGSQTVQSGPVEREGNAHAVKHDDSKLDHILQSGARGEPSDESAPSLVDIKDG